MRAPITAPTGDEVMIRAWAATLGGLASKGAFVGHSGRRADKPARTPDPWEGEYARGGVEPPLEDVLSDPIIQLVMRSDRLDQAHVRRTAHALRAGGLGR